MAAVSDARRRSRRPLGPTCLAVLVAALTLTAAGCGDRVEQKAAGDQQRTEAAAPAETPKALPRLMDLGADKCVPCKMMAPILEELKTTHADRFEVQFVDVWKDPAPGKQYGVRVIPTQIFFDEEGNELARHQGFMGKDDILAKWRELGYEFGD
ncbi:MAG: thioredoxin family protein [Candidatus Eisenbacteria bacterium]|nr:thioredoxin family protein [Candidatus Eisenbacteria bacterium]